MADKEKKKRIRAYNKGSWDKFGNYKVTLFVNGIRRKVYWTYNEEKWARMRYEKMIGENVVFYARKQADYKPVEYELCLMKKRAEGDTNSYYYKDNTGKFVEQKEGEWYVLEKSPYYFEQLFFVYGEKNKLSAKEIFDRYITSDFDRTKIKEICYSNNKLIIMYDLEYLAKKKKEGSVLESKEKTHVVICKDKNEVRDFYHFVMMKLYENELYMRFIFNGEVTTKSVFSINKRIRETTGMSNRLLYRQSTRK